MVKLLAELAPAKINLFLRVVGRRADGYHDLDSIFLPISLCDSIQLTLRTAPAISIVIRCDSEGAPSDHRNLAARAAAAFMAEFGIAAEVLIDLNKRIPVGAGLGGGSSDAGAILRMMAALCRIHQPERLARVALGLGADVPFFLNPRPSRVQGIGERLTSLESMPRLHLVIAAPPFEVSTAEVFRDLRPEEWSGAALESDLAAITAGEVRPAALVNDLERAALRRRPEIGQLKAILHALGASASAMTGSGGAVFGVFQSADEAGRAAEEARRLSPGSRFVAASTLDHPAPRSAS